MVVTLTRATIALVLGIVVLVSNQWILAWQQREIARYIEMRGTTDWGMLPDIFPLWLSIWPIVFVAGVTLIAWGFWSVWRLLKVRRGGA